MVQRTMSCQIAPPSKAFLASLAVESLGWRIGARSPRRHWCLLHLWLTSISSRDISHIPRRSPGGLRVVKCFSQSRFHLDVWRVRRIRVDGVVHGARFGLHCGLIQLRVLQILLVKLCFRGGGCSGCRILAVQDGREVHDPIRRSARDRGQGQPEKLPADSCTAQGCA